MSNAPNRRDFLNFNLHSFTGSFLGTAFLPEVIRSAEPAVNGMVTGQPQGAEAGKIVLANGGNAVDAAVAAALVAAVVAVPGTGIAGYGGHLVVAKPNGVVSAIDFNTVAPAALKPDTFEVDEKGNVKGDTNTFGWLSAGVPGIPAGLQLALDKFGTKPFAELVKPAIRYAREGFPVDRTFASALKAAKLRLSKDPGSAKILFKKGEPLAEGDTYRNPDLADLLQMLADRGGVGTFYKGDIADRIAAAFQKNGGILSADDLANYRAQEVTPLKIEFQGHTICTPPPSSGGLTVLQALLALKALDWPKWNSKEAATTQALIEALRIAWNDRQQFLGDPKFANVPVERLLSDKYAQETADRVRASVKNKKPIEGKSDGRPSGGTIHLSAIDANGLSVALTLTHGGYFGAQVTIDGLGLLLGHGISRFDPRPGRANSPAPGKRPLHNMCPTVVLRDGKPVMALGATGGRRIVNSVFEVLAYKLGQGQSLAEAVKAPRIHTEGDTSLT
ncbi:MAG TPA: gamma-glutamyltransferase, partial [Gemmata sp.]|nr:gamma-glutamyltransferase [Gemmata sp.]